MVPLIIAVILRMICPSLTSKIALHAPALSVVLLFLVIMGCMAGLDYFFFKAYAYVIGALLSSAICLILCFILSWFLSFKRHYSDKITAAIVCTWINTGLAVVIADKFFRHNSPDVILFVSLAVIPWNLMVFALKFLSSARDR
jgi:predicted Na+-dependent transporter